MAVTGQQVYNMAITLIGQRADNGAIPLATTKTYLAKALDILTLGQMELAQVENKTLEAPIISNLTQELEISDNTAIKVLPYFLAYNFLLEENPNISNFFSQKYEELRRKIPQTAVTIIDVYDAGNTGGA